MLRLRHFPHGERPLHCTIDQHILFTVSSTCTFAFLTRQLLHACTVRLGFSIAHETVTGFCVHLVSTYAPFEWWEADLAAGRLLDARSGTVLVTLIP